MATRSTTTRSTTTRAASKKTATITTEEGGKHSVYDPAASREAFKKGDVVFFPKVRNWLEKGTITEAYGKVVNVQVFDNELPFIEVSFDDTKKLNKVDLGKDIRKFLLEVK
jgi:hypothetical protein